MQQLVLVLRMRKRRLGSPGATSWPRRRSHHLGRSVPVPPRASSPTSTSLTSRYSAVPHPHPRTTSSPLAALANLRYLDSLQVLRASLAEIPPKHEEEVEALTRSYKDQYCNWLFELRSLPKPAVLMQPWDWFGQFYCCR